MVLPGERQSQNVWSYQELQAAFKQPFTPSEAERKSQKVKLWAIRQRDEESVIDFNHHFEAVASCCIHGDDKIKDIYLDCLKAKLREALAIHALETLPQAMRDAVSVDVYLRKLSQQTQIAQTVGQVNHLTSCFQDMGTASYHSTS